MPDEKEKMKAALEILKKYNPIRNDTDAYLHCIAEWGLGMRLVKPDPKDYGLEN